MRHNADFRRLYAHADTADVAAFRSASGASVELMRATYRTQAFSRHTHEYFTIGVVLRGVGSLWYRGADCVTRCGDVVVIPPGEVHTGGLGAGTTLLSYLAVHVPAEVLTMCADAEGVRGGMAPDFSSVIIRDRAVGAELRRLDSVMRTTHSHGAVTQRRGRAPDAGFDDAGVDHAAADDALSLAIGLLVSHHADPAHRRARAASIGEPNLVRIARQIIEDCYADSTQTSLGALASRTGVTPFHLVRVFTHTTGLSPHRYLVQTRVRRASELLARGVPASLVAAMTGFVDQSHLTAQFKRHVGTTPVVYQRCMRGASAVERRDAYRE